MGYSNNNIQVFIKGSEELLGEIVDVKITEAKRTSLKGVLEQ
jgi:tRNA-2-methylthio-N6-dimethylallyladenosine synthase